MNKRPAYRSNVNVLNRLLDLFRDHLRPRSRVLAPIVLVIDRADDEVATRRRSR
jgi:hypothetical protein